MSPNENPDFWRSQGTPPTPPNSTPKKSSSSTNKSDDNSIAGSGNAATPGSSAGKGAAHPEVPKSGTSAPKISNSDASDPSAAKSTNLPVPPANPAASPTGGTGSGVPVDAINKKIDSIGSKKPDKLDDPNRTGPKTDLGRDVEMGKEAAKGAVGGALKGAAKGAVTGGLAGAAAGAGKEALVKTAERINKTSARQRADQNKGPSNRDSLIDKAASSGLDKSRGDMSQKFGGGGAESAAGGGGLADVSPQQVAELAKAAATVTERLVVRVAKTAVVSMVLVIGLFLAMISALAGAVAPVAAASAAYQASTTSCAAPSSSTASSGDSTLGTPSPGSHGSEDGLKPSAIKAMRFINSQWGGEISDIGGVRSGGDAEDHATGNALDVMIPDYKSDTGKALGTEIANYLQKNADKYGVTYIIWSDKFWNNSGGSSWTYTGTGQTYGPLEWAPYNSHGATGDTGLHYDHVHISFKDQPGEPLSTGTTTVSLTSDNAGVLGPITRAANVTAVPADGGSNLPAAYGLTTSDQVTNAKIIMGMAKTLGLGKEGAMIGVTVAVDESTLVNLDHGDRDSIGLFQQRPSMNWGTKDEIMNPVYSSQAFFLGAGTNPGLTSLTDWKSLPVQVAAQKVQKSGTADGSNYAKDIPTATKLVDGLFDSTPPTPATSIGGVTPPDSSGNTTTSSNCADTASLTTGSIAAGDNYPANKESYCRTDACYAVQKSDSVSGAGYRGECVDWAGWKLLDRTGLYGSYHVVGLGNGGDWGDSAGPGTKFDFPVDMSPVAGDTVFFKKGKGGATSDAGHVATVSAVNADGTVTIEEYNFGGDTSETGGGRYHTRNIPVSEASGYIHFFDPKKTPEENKANLIAKGILVPGKTTWPRGTAV